VNNIEDNMNDEKFLTLWKDNIQSLRSTENRMELITFVLSIIMILSGYTFFAISLILLILSYLISHHELTANFDILTDYYIYDIEGSETKQTHFTRYCNTAMIASLLTNMIIFSFIKIFDN
jgi:hypothetical protein